MKPEIKSLWVNALRSGKYRQGRGLLKDPEGKFCCLGVLCELHRKINKKSGWKSDLISDRYLDAEVLLPDKVIKWAGLTCDNPRVNIESWISPNGEVIRHRPMLLSQCNDAGMIFEHIASLIEEQL